MAIDVHRNLGCNLECRHSYISRAGVFFFKEIRLQLSSAAGLKFFMSSVPYFSFEIIDASVVS